MSAPIPRPGPPSRPVPGPPPSADAAGPTASADAAGPPASADAESTVAAVRAAGAELDRLDDLPVAEHVARYDALHGTLSEALAAIDGV